MTQMQLCYARLFMQGYSSFLRPIISSIATRHHKRYPIHYATPESLKIQLHACHGLKLGLMNCPVSQKCVMGLFTAVLVSLNVTFSLQLPFSYQKCTQRTNRPLFSLLFYICAATVSSMMRCNDMMRRSSLS